MGHWFLRSNPDAECRKVNSRCSQVSIVPSPEAVQENEEGAYALAAEDSRVTSEPRSEVTVQPAPKQLNHK